VKPRICPTPECGAPSLPDRRLCSRCHKRAYRAAHPVRAWFNRFRSILTRWSKKADNYLGMLCFVCGLIAYRAALFFG